MAGYGGKTLGSNITSSNATFSLTCEAVFNSAAIILENWSVDRFLEAENLTITELKMSIDGFLNAASVPRVVEMTLNFSATSKSIEIIEAIVEAQQETRTPMELNGEVMIPAINRKYTMIRGFFKDVSILPNLGQEQEERTYHITWQGIQPVGL